MIPPPTPKREANRPALRPISARGSRCAPAAGWPVLGSIAVSVSDRRLEAALAPLRDRLPEAAVFCDVDGTLAPIVPRPEDSRLLDGVREALEELRERVLLLAFVSGRGLADVERLVGLPGCAYAGNHGMELHRVGRDPELAEGVAEHLAAIAAFVADWPPGRLAEGDLRLEAKGATVSVHARGARDPEAARLQLARIASDALDRGLVPSSGREVLEVRPPVAVDKGTAVRALLRDSGARAALYIGDDRTDADAWRALRAMRVEGAVESAIGIAVAAGEVPASVREEADVEVPGPEGALGVLRHLTQG
jgi:trehalose 6-phosphate phosphatase